eukprot:TRINITY_DN810_c0_g1_i1.p1 TRINITY_DN810_c0_g1~~TRINITY_DN810_c0_g1_i1.p1  ORF type:complete len:122 (+),score=17.47 TRINITY_DN810_c0_g1_i1:28-366(+)
MEPLLMLPGPLYKNLSMECNGKIIDISEDSQGNIDGTGGSMWDGAAVLSSFLKKNPHIVDHKHVLEVGSGVGLVSIVAKYLGATRVVASDQIEVVDNLVHNLSKNLQGYEVC